MIITEILLLHSDLWNNMNEIQWINLIAFIIGALITIFIVSFSNIWRNTSKRFIQVQWVNQVTTIQDGCNPCTWMILLITSTWSLVSFYHFTFYFKVKRFLFFKLLHYLKKPMHFVFEIVHKNKPSRIR